MKQAIYTVTENTPLTSNVFNLRVCGDTSQITTPGQFVAIQLPGYFLRRPFSVCDWDDTGFNVIYKTVGHGTEYLSTLSNGAQLDILTGMGNGFHTQPKDIDDSLNIGMHPLLIGGGVGVPPLYALAKLLLREGFSPLLIMGFNTAAEIFYANEFSALGLPVTITTTDGSCGTSGFVTDALPPCNMYSYVFTCGPRSMLKAVYDATCCPGQYSFEERMGCGFGACMGCTCKTTHGAKQLCQHGPVLRREEIVW